MSVTRASVYAASATEPAGASAEGGIKLNREDTATGTTPVPVPQTASGTAYSWHKNLALEVTTATATTISQRRVWWGSALTTGLYGFFRGISAYAQSAAPGADDATTNGAVPASYTALTATTQGGAHVWHAAGVSANSLGRNGDFLRIVGGIGANFTGGAGAATAMPSLNLSYDEA